MILENRQRAVVQYMNLVLAEKRDLADRKLFSRFSRFAASLQLWPPRIVAVFVSFRNFYRGAQFSSIFPPFCRRIFAEAIDVMSNLTSMFQLQALNSPSTQRTKHHAVILC